MHSRVRVGISLFWAVALVSGVQANLCHSLAGARAGRDGVMQMSASAAEWFKPDGANGGPDTQLQRQRTSGVVR